MNINHIRKRGGIYHARMRIPEDVQKSFFGQKEFSQSLQTGLQSEALQRLSVVITRWLQQIKEARSTLLSTQVNPPGDDWAKQWLAEISNPKHQDIRDSLKDISETDLQEKHEAGLIPLPEAQKAYSIVIGLHVPLNLHADAFLDSMYAGKSRSSMSGALNHFLNHFDTPQDITPKALRSWWQVEAKANSASTVERVLSVAKGYMRYLRDNDLAKRQYTNLLKDEDLKTPRTAAKAVPYKPFTVPECLRLLEHAKNLRGSLNLILLMKVGMYTGARIEEVASIKREDIHMDEDWMMIRGTKTVASENREVPIHPELKVILEEALASHNDAFLIPNLPMDKHGSRANAIGKQFGRLKTAVGFTTRSNCFHSYRKTFVTQMEQAGVSEGVVADIVGHEKNTITYGIYSGGSSLLQKRTAILNLSF